MHVFVYLLTLSESAEDAKSDVRIWLDEHSGLEFFDYGDIYEPEKVVHASDIRKELEHAKAETENILADIQNHIGKSKKSGDRKMEGYYYKCYGNVLMENCCQDMPFFNITDWSWGIPTEAEGSDWYAVSVNLHY